MVKNKTSLSISKRIIGVRLIKFYILPFLLILFSLLLAGFTSLTMDASFTVLPSKHYFNVTLEPQKIRLFKGETIKGKFIATENNLGSVAVKLKNYNEGNTKDGRKIVKEDVILFRIKEEGQKNWYYENKYNGGQFHELNYFPFGFPTIDNSKNKKYVFEIISKDGNYENVLTLTHGYPLIKTNYKFDKNILLHDREKLLNFLLQKQLYSLTIIDYYFALLIYLLPFMFYLLWLSPVGRIIDYPSRLFYKKLKKLFSNKYFRFIGNRSSGVTIYEVFILLGILIDIIFIHFPNQLILFLLIFLWVMQLIIKKRESRISFSIAFILLCLCSVVFLFQQELRAEKIAVWIFYFMLIGSIHSLIEMKVFKK